MQFTSTLLLVLVLALGIVVDIAAQSDIQQSSARYYRESGSFYYKNYAAKEYKASTQNFGVLQDLAGNMVFANGDGVLIYDGKKWTLVETPTESVIRSMAMDQKGKIYVGALDDLGYLEKTKTGKPVYVSLLDKIKPDLQKMGNIWSTHVVNNEVFFEAETGMFKWNNEKFTFWPWPDPLAWHKTFFWNNTLYLCEQGKGLMQFRDNSFIVSPGGEYFRNMRIYAAMPLSENKIVLATKYDGLFIYDGTIVKVFESEANDYLRTREVYAGRILPDKTMLLASKFGGVLWLETTGAIRAMITRQQGLPTDNVRALTTDINGDLWLALDEGISHVEISNGITIYDERTGLESAVNDICRYQGTVYVTNSNGAYVLKESILPTQFARFESIGLPKEASCWTLLKVEDRLLISSSIGLFELRAGEITQITERPTYAVHRFKADSTRILLAQDKDLQTLQLREGKWKQRGLVPDIGLDNIKFNETRPGKVWLTTYSQGAVLVSYVDQKGNVNYDSATVSRFTSSNGLPEGFIKISSIDGIESFRVGTESALFTFDYNKNHFYPDSTFGIRHGLKTGNFFPVTNELPSGEFLFKSKRGNDGVRQLYIIRPTPDKHYTFERYDLSRIFESVGVITFWDQESNVIWHVGMELIARQKLSHVQRDTTRFAAHINKIIIGADSVFQEGIVADRQDVEFPHELGSMRFEFTSNNLIAEETNAFQHKLQGYDEEWSDWSVESIKEYSRLWEGDYTFWVRSKDFAGHISQPESIHFSISPPWYRSMIAYILYVVAAGYIIWLLIRWRSHKLEQEKLSLQAEIQHQTQEIREQNIQLAAQSEELKTNAEQLKELDTMKSNFFVNISHEFRTPLSLILGPLEKMIDTESTHIRAGELDRMHRNAKRLQQLINQLLDLAKLESGKMKIVATQSDLLYFVRVVTASFESLADVRNIQFEVQIPPGTYVTSFDNDKLETVIINLLSNAFKFTPEEGRIDFILSTPSDTDAGVSMIIADTGPGISQHDIARIFDRFYQVDGSSSRSYEGSGIGLSLVKELVSLMNGTVSVQSKIHHGTAFTISLPFIAVTDGPVADIDDNLVADVSQVNQPVPYKGNDADSPPEFNTHKSEAVILLIEDNPDLRDYLRESLELEYGVEIAENGQVGLERALELIPDLILSDMMMPIMDGFTLCTNIRSDERTSHIPFILLTARTTIESKLAGLELGADEYMTKPFNMKEVMVRIKNLLDQRTSLRRSFSKEVTLKPKNISITSVDERFLNHALEILEKHLSDQQFSVERFAEEIGMSRKNLLRKVKALTDQSVNEFIRNFRLNRAAQLIEGRSGTISEIAYGVGFNNLSYFSKCFKDLFGVLPNEKAAKSTIQ